MSGEVKTQGTTLSRGTGTGSPETFETVPGLQNFDGPTSSRGEIDITDLSSTSKEYLLSLVDNGTMSFSCKLIPTSSVHQAIIDTDLGADTPGNWKLTLSDGTIMAFAASVKEFPISGGTEDVVKGNLTLRLSGDITWSYAS
jgi:predicted secreted protein